jgi:hypothetical protein
MLPIKACLDQLILGLGRKLPSKLYREPGDWQRTKGDSDCRCDFGGKKSGRPHKAADRERRHLSADPAAAGAAGKVHRD